MLTGAVVLGFPTNWKIPLDSWVSAGLDWVVDNFSWLFAFVSGVLRWLLLNLERGLLATPWLLVVCVVAALAWLAGNWKLAVASASGFTLIGLIGMWKLAMETLALVGTATFLSVAIGVPLGVLCAASPRLWSLVRPSLDLMQTMPSFVYLVPALMMFGLGRVPALIATIAYAVPPAVRLTNHGIRQVPEETVEAAVSFGATRSQLLRRVQLPLAFPTIMAGVNQTIMMALSMVVVASMIGAGGLGREVLEGLSRLDVGRAFVGGLGIVVLAITIDRIAAAAAAPRRTKMIKNSRKRSRPEPEGEAV